MVFGDSEASSIDGGDQAARVFCFSMRTWVTPVIKSCVAGFGPYNVSAINDYF